MQIVHDFMALHRIPELDRQLPKTRAYIKAALEKTGCQVFHPVPDALCGFFDFGKKQALVFRADMDGLPIQEKTGLDYASAHPGQMHACGHDGHMAVLLELARRLALKRENPYNVLLLFQPAEETSGGARELCRSGLFEKYAVRAVFGLHLWPGLGEGLIASRPGVLMCRSCGVTVRFTGRSAHVARSKEGRDAMAACVSFYTRTARAKRRYLLLFGKMTCGTAPNCVCDSALLEGTLRAFDRRVFTRRKKRLLALARRAAEKAGCQAEISFSDGYPALINPPRLLRKVQAQVPFQVLPSPFLTTEDFSYYLAQCPGLFFLLGTGTTPPLHADDFVFDPKILLKGADFFEKLAGASL